MKGQIMTFAEYFKMLQFNPEYKPVIEFSKLNSYRLEPTMEGAVKLSQKDAATGVLTEMILRKTEAALLVSELCRALELVR